MSDGQIVIDARLNTDGVNSGGRRIQTEAKKAGKSFNKAGKIAEREWVTQCKKLFKVFE